MKKIIALIFAAITIMISCAGPLMVKANAANVDISSFDKFVSYTGFNRDSTDYYYCYFTIDYTRDDVNNTIGVCVSYSKASECPYYIEYSNNILVVRSLTVSDSLDYAFADTYTNGHIIWRDGYALQLDFNNNVGYIIDTDSRYEGFTFGNIETFTFDNFETTFSEYDPVEPLDLDISFKPTLSGEISRKQTIDGKVYTSTTLDMYVSNNGSSDAQFAMFIVPRGDSITFPDHMIQDNKGFIGNPVFVYVSDEWSSFTAGLVGSSVYAPCSWHTVPKGFQNQLYSISWNQMSLQPDTQYDCVVYGCVNSTATQTNTSSQWEMRPVYTVTSSLDDVEEVYRSSFTITDPAEFNPNFIDEAGASHPWNPNADNSNLFNVASAYRDDNGNVVIKGQTGGGNNIFTADLNTQNINANVLFGDTFKFFTSFLGQCPPAWVAILTVGLSAIVAVAIIKKVT